MKAHGFLQAGRFNVRLQLQDSIQTDDGCGGTTQAWHSVFEVWARIVPIKGILVATAGDQHADYTHWIYVRKRDGIRPGMRFVSGTRDFMIDTVSDPDETGRYLLCEARETP